jgi:hypothetical protein
LPRPLTAGAVIAGLGLATTAWAAIPGPDGVIQACYAKATGTLRVIDAARSQACKPRKEQAITWNQRGPEGDRGSRGPRGEAGPQGPKGAPGAASSIHTTAGRGSADGPGYETIAALDLPTGRFLLTGKGQATSGMVTCGVYDPAGRQLDGSASAGVLAFHSFVELGSPTTITVDCAGGDVSVALTGIAVGSIHVQSERAQDPRTRPPRGSG